MAAERAAWVLATIEAAEGSAPRGPGAWMRVFANTVEGSVGGGALEHRAIARARAMLREGAGPGAGAETLTLPLGPDLGQCCGGRVRLRLEPGGDAGPLAAAEAAARPVAMIHGAGHVGRALAAALALLPVRTVVLDGRESELAQAPGAVERRLTALPEAEVAAAPAGAAHVVTTHDHGLDFLIATAALARGDAAYVGLIGSATKRARFERFARGRGVDPAPLVCPVGAMGGAGLADKRPAVIAAMVAAELMAAFAAARGG
ncbi:xanthine dehydrogenase accessory protein XdhC [Rubrimonas cliftonensis]|uniref:Molybdenum cofactor sulfurylase n=1 Tax=Rubrimonas cliftonensis TaxID=89524 RepID=A0A1H3YUR1_9RHOB|nr:xanthine dehydrogenase accessory protein XdhC [Rubrimonas cliftonensis]SEA15293.1 molybdenum cofactor sulfurylase [Rubrimonas cliftonensis]